MAQSQAAQSQATGKIHSSRSIIAGGLLAGVAAAVAFTVASPAPATPAQAAMATASKQQCDVAPRKLMVSTAAEWGVVRLRSGSYLSPPIVLTSTPQSAVFPRARPDINPEDETILVEGNVSNVVITSELTSFRKELDNIDGAAPFTVRWAPRKPC
jgi:hypothetical protein